MERTRNQLKFVFSENNKLFMKFSDRLGVTQVKTIMQIDEIDQALKNRVWNNFLEDFLSLDNVQFMKQWDTKEQILKIIWTEFLIKIIDEIPRFHNRSMDHSSTINQIKSKFFSWEWYDIYNFIEFIIPISREINSRFEDKVNRSLEFEVSAYRIVNGLITRITSDLEINEIEEAIGSSNSYVSVQTHLNAALEYLSRRGNPDYRNSIKESISGLEAFCKIITDDDKNTLGKALGILKNDHNLHPSLHKSFSALYGYTSDAGGIRHAMSEGENEIHFEDAKLILVTCSAFINYLKVKIPVASQ